MTVADAVDNAPSAEPAGSLLVLAELEKLKKEVRWSNIGLMLAVASLGAVLYLTRKA